MIFSLIARLSKHNATPAVLGLLAAALLLRTLWLWQPARQVMLHQNQLLDSAEDRDWKRFSGFVDDQFSDRWGHDKTFFTRESAEVLRQFFTLTIRRDLVECALLQSDRATVTMRLKLEGKGTPVALYAAAAVDRLTEPFSFQWKRRSWKPWDWVLLSADQPQLRLDRVEGF